MGLYSVFELIKVSRKLQPDFCLKALLALYKTLHGLKLEALQVETPQALGKNGYIKWLYKMVMLHYLLCSGIRLGNIWGRAFAGCRYGILLMTRHSRINVRTRWQTYNNLKQVLGKFSG